MAIDYKIFPLDIDGLKYYIEFYNDANSQNGDLYLQIYNHETGPNITGQFMTVGSGGVGGMGISVGEGGGGGQSGEVALNPSVQFKHPIYSINVGGSNDGTSSITSYSALLLKSSTGDPGT